MKKMKNMPFKQMLLLLAFVTLLLAGCGTNDNQINEVPTQDTYGYVNPDESKAEADTGIVIDGVLEEEVYQNNNWLYLHNDDGGNNVNIAMTSYYGEKGMYFVYDVTESVPIYVNTKRGSYMNSCIEMYLAPSYLSTVQDNSIFEIDLMPTGDMIFKKSNGRYGYTDVMTTSDKMAVLGATTKGGEVNTPECYGYCLELFIPWDYMTWLDMDIRSMRDSFVYVNPAHITSNNLDGTDSNLDRYWYFYAQQNGAEFTDVSQYFRFNGEGVMGTVPVVLENGENCTVTGVPNVIPGMNTIVNVVPDEGYTLTSIIVNGEEMIQYASFNEDGSVTLTVRGTTDGVTVSAKAEAVTQGAKSLSGRVVLNNINRDSLDGLLMTYVGPKGEKPVEIGADGKFELKNMEQGYYVLKAEKEGYTSVNRGIYLNQDFYTELVLEYNYFQTTQGSCWILDKQNNGVIYKMGGNGALMSNKSYNNFDYSVNLRYDKALTEMGWSDYFVQQRSGMRIEFSNGKTWHIDLMKENDRYIVQYARFSGDNSVTDWRTVHVLNDAQIAKYQSKVGICLRIMRQGQHMAVWLDNTLLVVEMFGDQYTTCTAKLGMEAWIANRTMMEIPFKISANLPVDVAGSPFHWPAEYWNISDQYNGTITKHPDPGKDTWLESKIISNDVTTISKDLSPDTKDYSMIYLFKFSNGENFGVRLNHTDNDGKYRIQSFAGSTVFAPWKNHYTLTDAQAEKVKNDGIEYRVWIAGTTAYVFIDGEVVCAYDLSKNVKTGNPSGIENATATVSFRVDGNLTGDTVIPFRLKINNENPPEIPLKPSEIPYDDFTATAYLKYNTKLATQGTTDAHVQQRSGMRISFSNGKNWHVHLMKENDKYILQYAKMSGNNSVTNWKTVCTLTDAQAAQYESADGIRLQIMRQGQHAAVWLGDTLLVIELFGDEYETCTVTIGPEAWITNQSAEDVVLNVCEGVPVDVAGSPFHWSANFWDISDQYSGTITKHPDPGKDTWLESKIISNDVTTISKDLSPDTKDYSMIYVFKFSNGENFGVRLNHTDNDGKYTIQSFAGSTVFAPWKNHYTLTDEQAEKVKTEGISYRVQILETTAYVFLDGEEVCTYDLSTNVNTGKPSGIENATATVSFRVDGNLTGDTVIPFRLKINNENPPEIPLKPSEIPYDDFTATAYLKYNTKLATQGTTDAHVQQRSGMRLSFSNGKNWHIHLMKENDKYILQYAKMSGNNSVTNWKTVCTLTEAQAAQYESAEGIRLQVMRQGRHVAVWLGDTLQVIELLAEEYLSYTAKIGPEAWVADLSAEDVSLSASGEVPVDVVNSPFHWPANFWDISDQYSGTITKHPDPGKDTWLESKIISNDVTTISKDLSPDTKDYSMIYVFKFSNGENFGVRLNHTDNDGKYTIQSFAGSTVFAPWKNHYTLTDEQAEKVKTEGISYRVQILETTAYVFLDGEEVCTYDLSTNVNTGKPSGIENATATVSFRLDGNTNGDTVIPFKLENNSKNVILNIADTDNGTITADKASYQLGDTVKLTVNGAEGYYYYELTVDGTPVSLNWDGTYSFVASKNRYDITGSFALGVFAENSDSAWNLTNQNRGQLLMQNHASGNSGYASSVGQVNDVYTVVKDRTPEAGDFSMIYRFTFSNHETFIVRLNHTDDDGRYRIQSMSGSTLVEAWQNAYTLTDEEAAKVCGDGIRFHVVIKGTTAYISLDGTEVCTYDLSKVIATDEPSGIENEQSTVAIRMDGNLNQDLEIPFRAVDSSVDVELIIEPLENGNVIPKQNSYRLGDIVTLTITPDAGYSQKLTIDGEPLLLDWKTSTYSFVAQKDSYVIGGSFVPSLQDAPSDAGRWDSSNQAHGMISTYYPNNNDSWWYQIEGEHEFLAVNAKNYLPQADSAEGNGTTGFSVVLAVTMDNGKTYGFRILNEKEGGNGNARYIYTRYGANGCVSGWGGWCALEAKAPGVTEKLQGDGAEFKLIRTGANTLHITLDGVILDVYTMEGVTAANKITSFGIFHYGNKGQMVDIPFALTYDPGEMPVSITIPALENGAVVAEKQNYRVGDTVTLTVAPDAGYSQKLTLDGEPLLLDWKTNSYSFVAKKDSYVIGGSFEPSLQDAPSDAGRWDSSNQAHGIISTYYPNNNDSWWYKFNGEYEFLAVTAKNYLPQADSAEGSGTVGFSVVLAVTMDNGKTYGFRILNEKEGGNGNARYIYTRYGANGCVSGWGGWCALEAKVPGVTEKLQGDGAEFKLIRTGANTLQITLDGVVLDTYTMDGVTATNKITAYGIYHYGNKGQKVDIPFALMDDPSAKPVTVTIPVFENGTVTTEKQSYRVGDTVTLVVTPAAGYSQKLTLDGEPLLLDWKSNTYSFVARKESYAIDGSFVPSLQDVPSDAGRWDSSNQAHGIISTYYPNNNDSWWYKFNGEYEFLAVTAKNYLPQADSAEGGGTFGFSTVLAVTLDNGKTYGFRILNEKENGNGTPRYIYTRFGAGGCVTGWGGWCMLEAKVPGITEKLQGDGAEFKLIRTGANTLQITLDGVVLDTYTMDGVTATNKITAYGIYHYGNKGQKVDIPFALMDDPSAKPVTVTIPVFENGTVTTEKQSYRVGDTVTLVVTPAAGYSQKLTIDGEPLLLDWKTSTYSFVARKESYAIDGSFVPSLQDVPSDAGRWDSSNQAHGVISTYYPSHNDSWWYKFNGDYNSIAVNAKNYLPQADSAEGGGKVGYAFTLAITLDNGKSYGFRFINEREGGNGAARYVYTRYGANGCVTGWNGWCMLESKIPGITDKLQGDGAEFKLTRTGANTLQITLDGVVLDTYTMDGVTATNKVTSVSIFHYGNKGHKVAIPFVLTPAPKSEELG